MDTDVSADVVRTRWMSSCGGKECVEVARPERPPLDEAEVVAVAGEDLLVLLAPVEADETPGEVVVDGGRRAGRDDESEERERLVLGPVEEPLADPAAHAAPGYRRSQLVGKPGMVGEQLGEPRPDRLARGLRRRSGRDLVADLVDEGPNDRRIEDVLPGHAWESDIYPEELERLEAAVTPAGAWSRFTTASSRRNTR